MYCFVCVLVLKTLQFLVCVEKQTDEKQASRFQTCAQTLDSGWLELIVGGDLIGPYEDAACALPSAEEPRERAGTAGEYFLKGQRESCVRINFERSSFKTELAPYDWCCGLG